MRIACPFCGDRDHSEFTYKRDATRRMPALDAPIADWVHAVYQRTDPAGRSRELWHHEHGCRAWLMIDRDTRTHDIVTIRPANPLATNAVAAEG